MLAQREDPTVIHSWLMGLNPELGDRVPVRLGSCENPQRILRERDLEILAPEIMGAARRFLAGS
jgi:hypothetical protein